jgi:hypothetical protein
LWLGVALVGCACFAVPAEAGLTAQQKRRACFPKGSRTVLVSHDVRAYTIDARSGDTDLRACLFSTGRSRVLATSDDILSVARAWALAGRFVAWEYRYTPGCRGQCPPSAVPLQTLSVTDLRSGLTRVASTSAARAGVTTRGSLVWIRSDGASGASLLVLDARGQRTLDSGDLDKGFLRVFGTFVLWRKGGQNHWADLAAARGTAAARSACRGGTRQLFRDRAVRVYRQGSVRTFACLFATGRRSRLLDGATGFRRAGRYLAYFARKPRIVATQSLDLRTGKVMWAAGLALEEQPPPAVRRLALRSSDGKYGAVVGSGAATQVIRARGLGGYDELDSGAGIAPGSLSATSSQLRWRNGGAARSAPLGPRDTTPAPRAQSCTFTTPSDFFTSTTPQLFDGEVSVILANSQDENPEWSFCRFRTGRRFKLPFLSHQFVRAGDYLLSRSPEGCGINPPEPVKLESRSVIDGRVVASDSLIGPSDACPRTQTVLRGSDGAFAYIVDPLRGQPLQVVAVRRTGRQVLDPGPGVEFGSLSLSGSTLTWRNGGAERTATL